MLPFRNILAGRLQVVRWECVATLRNRFSAVSARWRLPEFARHRHPDSLLIVIVIFREKRVVIAFVAVERFHRGKDFTVVTRRRDEDKIEDLGAKIWRVILGEADSQRRYPCDTLKQADRMDLGHERANTRRRFFKWRI